MVLILKAMILDNRLFQIDSCSIFKCLDTNHRFIISPFLEKRLLEMPVDLILASLGFD
jgi:hypothetical protein